MTINNIKNRKKIQAALVVTAGTPVFIICSFAFLSIVDDLRLEIPLLILITALVTIVIACALYLDETILNTRNTALSSWFIIIFVALVIRGFFIFQPVRLSDDIFRYYIDGHQLLTGHNPYAKAPEDLVDQTPFVSKVLSQVNHPELVSLYPPAAQFVFAAGAIFKSLSGIKALLVIMDIGTCILLIILLGRLKLPISRSILYAWHPLPVLETASSGHVDSAAIFFMLLSFLLVCNQNSFKTQTNSDTSLSEKGALAAIFSGFFFSSAFLTKLFPIVFIPTVFILAEKKNRIYFITGFFTGTGILSAFFFPDIVNTFNTLVLYTKTWEFSGFIFQQLRQLTHSGNLSRLILTGCFALVISFSSLRLYLSKADTENSIFINTMKTAYTISFCYLLLTPTLHPWYALYLVLFLPFVQGSAGLILSWAVFLAYYILTPYAILGIWEENALVPFLIFSAPALAFILYWLSLMAAIMRKQQYKSAL